MAKKIRKTTEEDKDWYKLGLLDGEKSVRKEAYRLGFQNGESQLKETIEKIRQCNKHLLDELTRLDRHKPVMGVLLDHKTINTVIRQSKKCNHIPLACRIKKLQEEAIKREAHDLLMSVTSESHFSSEEK